MTHLWGEIQGWNNRMFPLHDQKAMKIIAILHHSEIKKVMKKRIINPYLEKNNEKHCFYPNFNVLLSRQTDGIVVTSKVICYKLLAIKGQT